MADYTRRLDRYVNVSTSYTFLTSTDYSSATQKIAGVAGWTIYIQKILLCVTTDNAATQTFQDDESTPIVVCGSKASPGIGPIEFDFGTEGFALTEGADLDHKMSAAGMAGSVTIQAYRKLTGTTTA